MAELVAIQRDMSIGDVTMLQNIALLKEVDALKLQLEQKSVIQTLTAAPDVELQRKYDEKVVQASMAMVDLNKMQNELVDVKQ